MADESRTLQRLHAKAMAQIEDNVAELRGKRSETTDVELARQLSLELLTLDHTTLAGMTALLYVYAMNTHNDEAMT